MKEVSVLATAAWGRARMVRCIVWILSVPSSPGINDPPAATLPPAVHVGVPPAVLRFYTSPR